MTKRTALYVVSAAILMMVLAACNVTIKPIPDPIRNFSFQSEFAEGSKNGAPVACENRNTTLEYSFVVDDINQLRPWKETYTGKQFGDSPGNRTKSRNLNRNSQGVSINGKTVTVTRTITAHSKYLPLAVDDSFAPSAIVVTPIPADPESQVGTTTFKVDIEAGSDSQTFKQDIKIYGNCNLGS